jgi:hypothetical protein
VKAYLSKLNKVVDQERERREQCSREAVQHARDRLSPVEDRLSRLLSTIRCEVQSDGLSLPALQSALRGRWRGSAHPGEVGRAMRKLGFVRRRNWRGDDRGFCALWFPPDSV